MIKHFYILLFSLFPFVGLSQFTTAGSTVQNCNCFELTQDGSANTIGSFHQNATIDLSLDFHLKFTVNFGCTGTGGEGIAFVMQTSAWVDGTGGAGLGYEGISNSLAIEFDTRDNETAGENALGDIPADHIAIQKNGVIDHNGIYNIGPTPLPNILPGIANIEDCEDHIVEIKWVAAAKTIEVIVDGTTSFGTHIVGDIVTDLFGGNSNVLWGWTGSTGALTNTQSVCLALEPDFTFTPTNCPNQPITFTSTTCSFNPITTYAWDFDGFGASALPNPSFTFLTAGNHPVTLTITDNAGCSNTEVFDLGIGFDVNVSASDLTVCPGSTTQLEVVAEPFVGNDCCFELKMTDLWDDGWAGNKLHVRVDGIEVGVYEPAINGAGASYTETHQICFSHGSNIEIEIDGDQFAAECSYQLIDQNSVVVLEVVSGAATWVDGDVQSFIVDCGIIPPVYTYSWDNAPLISNTSINNPVATIPDVWPATVTFTVDVTDPATACTIAESITITPSEPVTATLSGAETVCQGSDGSLTITFTGTGPYDVTYRDPNNVLITVTNIAVNPYNFDAGINGLYTIQSVTGNGCAGSVNGTGTITVIIPPSVDIESSESYCDGDIINAINVVSANGGTVNWYTNAALSGVPVHTGASFTPPSIVGSTVYYAQEVEAINSCGGPGDNVIITVNPIPPAPNVIGVTEYCENEVPTPLTSEMSLGGNPSWFDNIGLILPTVSTLIEFNPTLTVGNLCYYVTETANLCTGPATQICVLTKPVPPAPIITGTITYCEGDTPTALSAPAVLGGTIDWYNSGGSSISTTTNYTPDLTLGDQTFSATESLNGCTSLSGTLSITVNILPTVDIIESENICLNDSVEVTAIHNDFDLLWSNGDTLPTSWLKPTVTSTIYVTATNPLCGSVMDSILVTVFELPIVTAGNDTVIGIGGEAVLWATGAPTFKWTPDVSQCIETNCSEVYVIPDQATVYVVDGVDKNSCHDYDTVLVDISGYMEVFIPNVFSPNNDGFNDLLIVDGPRLFDFKMEIFDRWGKLIFTSLDQKDSWDGSFKGNNLAPQTFVYKVKGETVLGEEILLTGNVSIIK